MGDDRRHLPTFAIERKDDDDDDRERRGFYSFSAAFLFQSRQLRERQKKRAAAAASPPNLPKRKRNQKIERDQSARPPTPKRKKERKKDNDGRTDKSTRSRDAYLELRFRPVRLGPVDPAERVLFARGVRSRRVFGGGHFDMCSGKYVRRIRICRMAGGLWNKPKKKDGVFCFLFRVLNGFLIP